MNEPFRCNPIDHDYQPIHRERMSEEVKREDNGSQTVEFQYDRLRLFCRKCGWVRDINNDS